MVTYTTTAQEKLDLENGIKVDLLDRMYFTAMDDHVLISNILSEKGLGTTISSKDAEPMCLEMDISTCGCNQHDDTTGYNGEDGGDPCTCYGVQTIYLGCYTPAGGDGEPSTVPGNTGPGPITTTTNNNGTNNGGTDSTSNSNPDATVATTTCTRCPELIEDKCQILKDATNNQFVQSAINNLKPSCFTKVENSYEIERRHNWDTEVYDYTPIYHPGQNYKVNVPVGAYTQGQAHNHPENDIPIPSWGDIRWTYECEDNNSPSNDGTAYNIVIVRNPQVTNATNTYGIIIDNFQVLGGHIQYEMNQPKVQAEPNINDKLKRINEKFKKKFDGVSNNQSALEKRYLEVFQDYGISLYKMNDQTNNWEKLKLQNPYDPSHPTAPNSVLTEPCNN